MKNEIPGFTGGKKDTQIQTVLNILGLIALFCIGAGIAVSV